MTQMFTIPSNILLVFGLAIVLLTIGFVIYGYIKGWKNVMPDYDPNQHIAKNKTIDVL